MNQLAVFAVLGGIMGGLLVFSAMLLAGQHLVRWLGLAEEPPLSAQLQPPAPPLRDLSERAGAPAIAALQAERGRLFRRAGVACTGTDEVKATAAGAAITGLTLEPSALAAADATLTSLGL